MSDKTPTPRTWAGDLGTEDVRASLKRRILTIPLMYPRNNTTTGVMWGADSNTTGIAPLQRNATVEKIYVAGFKRTTVNGKTTLLYGILYKNGASTVASFVMRNSTTLGERWHAWSTQARLPSLVSTDRLSFKVVTRNQVTRLCATLVYREAADS